MAPVLMQLACAPVSTSACNVFCVSSSNSTNTSISSCTSLWLGFPRHSLMSCCGVMSCLGWSTTCVGSVAALRLGLRTVVHSSSEDDVGWSGCSCVTRAELVRWGCRVGLFCCCLLGDSVTPYVVTSLASSSVVGAVDAVPLNNSSMRLGWACFWGAGCCGLRRRGGLLVIALLLTAAAPGSAGVAEALFLPGGGPAPGPPRPPYCCCGGCGPRPPLPLPRPRGASF